MDITRKNCSLIKNVSLFLVFFFLYGKFICYSFLGLNLIEC